MKYVRLPIPLKVIFW